MMGRSNIFLMLLAGVVALGSAGTLVADEESKLIFVPALRVVAKTKLGLVFRGELKALSASAALIVPDRSRLRNPNGVKYQLDKLQSLNIPDAELKWKNGEDRVQFLIKIFQQENLPILNRIEIKLEDLSKGDLDPSATKSGKTMPGKTMPDKKMIMRPANLGSKRKDPLKPTVTVVCGNCFKEVAVDSESGQKCPHCGILWDNSPTENTNSSKAMRPANSVASAPPGPAMKPGEPVNLGANAAFQQGGQPAAAPQKIAQGGQPVTVPQPIQFQAQSQEFTLETIPVWLKAAIFCVCMGILYYAVFVR